MTTDAKNRIQATTLSEQDCREILVRLIDGRSSNGVAVKGRFTPMAAAIKTRDEHFYADEKANPRLAAPFDKRQTFQTDALRRVYSKAMTRMTEHPVQVHVEPRDQTQDDTEAANALERYLERGLRTIEERNGYSLQGFMAHGQMLHGFGVLRVVDNRRWPKVASFTGRRTSLDGLDPKDAANYEAEAQATDVRPTYALKPTVQMQNYRDAKADAPFPFYFDVPRTDTIGFVDDRFAENGMSVDVFVESIAALEYAQKIWTGDGFTLTRDDTTKALTVGTLGSGQRPELFERSGGIEAWGEMRVAQILTSGTRDPDTGQQTKPGECYELASVGTGEWSLVKSFTHDFGMTPVALAKAMVTNHPDPLYRYEPFLLGIFRAKPLYDLERNLGRLLAEEVAVKKYWAELPNGQAWLDSRGEKIVFSADSALVDKMPAGAKLVSADMTIDPAFIQFLERSKNDLDESIPETGFFDFGANTQPHTAVMAQMQSNTEIADLKMEQAQTFRMLLQACVRCMAEWADRGDGVVIRTTEGKLVEPTAEMLRGMTIEVKIEPNSGAQQVANEQYLREKTRDPNALYTIDEYLEATGREDTDAVKDKWIAEKVDMRMWPQVAMQETAKFLGDAYVLTPGMTAVGLDGKPASPLDVLAANGFEVLVQDAPPIAGPPAGPPGAGGPAPLPSPTVAASPLEPTLPPLSALPPGQVPTGARVGVINP